MSDHSLKLTQHLLSTIMSVNVSLPLAGQTPWTISNYTIPSASLLLSKAQHSGSWLATTLAIVGSLLVLEQVVYRSKKGNLPGATWTIPIIGKFADSLNPTLENYQKGWDLGPLSAISVFNM